MFQMLTNNGMEQWYLMTGEKVNNKYHCCNTIIWYYSIYTYINTETSLTSIYHVDVTIIIISFSKSMNGYVQLLDSISR